MRRAFPGWGWLLAGLSGPIAVTLLVHYALQGIIAAAALDVLPSVGDTDAAEVLAQAVIDEHPADRLVKTDVAGYAVTYVHDGKPVVAGAFSGEDATSVNARAIDALNRLLPPFEDTPIAKGSSVRMICFADGHDADRLLLVDRWAPLAETVDGELIAVAPSRDLVLFTGDADPTAIEAMLEMADVVYATDPHPITPIAVQWTPAGWMPYRP